MLNKANKAEWMAGWQSGCVVVAASVQLKDGHEYIPALLASWQDRTANGLTAGGAGYVAALASAVGVL